MSGMDAKAAEAELIAYARSFPQAWEDYPWEHTVMKVGKKIFVFFGGDAAPKDELSVTVKLPISSEMLWKAGWVHMRQKSGDQFDLETVRGWIKQSYRAVAPRKFVKLLDA